jgi:hypothetical protein
MTTPDPRNLIQRAQSQTQANRYAFLIRQLNAKLTEKIRNS